MALKYVWHPGSMIPQLRISGRVGGNSNDKFADGATSKEGRTPYVSWVVPAGPCIWIVCVGHPRAVNFVRRAGDLLIWLLSHTESYKFLYCSFGAALQDD